MTSSDIASKTEPVRGRILAYNPGHGLDLMAVGYDLGVNRQGPNQDYYWPYPDGAWADDERIDTIDYILAGRLYVVTDGVSGGLLPARASELAASTVGTAYYRMVSEHVARECVADEPPSFALLASFLRRAIILAHQTLLAESRAERSRLPTDQQTPTNFMQTTIACAVFRGRQVLTAHVGDSRVYALHEHRLVQLTADQVDGDGNPSALLGANLTEERVLTSTPDDLLKAYNLSNLINGDAILICSDGLYKFMGPTDDIARLEIERLLEQALAGGLAVREPVGKMLVEAARKQQTRSSDNITALVIPIWSEFNAKNRAQEIRVKLSNGKLDDAAQLAAELAWWEPFHFDGRMPAYRRLGDMHWQQAISLPPGDLSGSEATRHGRQALHLFSDKALFWHLQFDEHVQDWSRWQAITGTAPFAASSVDVSRTLPAQERVGQVTDERERLWDALLQAYELWPQIGALARPALNASLDAAERAYHADDLFGSVYYLACVWQAVVDARASDEDCRKACDLKERQKARQGELLRPKLPPGKDDLDRWLALAFLTGSLRMLQITSDRLVTVLTDRIEAGDFRKAIVSARVIASCADETNQQIAQDAFAGYCVAKAHQALRLLQRGLSLREGDYQGYLHLCNQARELLCLRDSVWDDLLKPSLIRDLEALLEELAVLAREAIYVERVGVQRQAEHLECIGHRAAALAHAGLIQLDKHPRPDFRAGVWQSDFVFQIHTTLFGSPALLQARPLIERGVQEQSLMHEKAREPVPAVKTEPQDDLSNSKSSTIGSPKHAPRHTARDLADNKPPRSSLKPGWRWPSIPVWLPVVLLLGTITFILLSIVWVALQISGVDWFSGFTDLIRTIFQTIFAAGGRI